MLYVVILVFGILALIQVPNMVKNKWWHDLIAYGILYFLALASFILYALQKPIPSPIKILTLFMHNAFQLLGLDIPE